MTVVNGTEYCCVHKCGQVQQVLDFIITYNTYNTRFILPIIPIIPAVPLEARAPTTRVDAREFQILSNVLYYRLIHCVA